jgi:hypothetical protein
MAQIGDTVHYQLVDPPAEPCPAWITSVSTTPGVVSLFVSTTSRTFWKLDVPQAETPTKGCWNLRPTPP